LLVDRYKPYAESLSDLLENADSGLSFDFRALLDDLRKDLITFDERVAEMDKKSTPSPIVSRLLNAY